MSSQPNQKKSPNPLSGGHLPGVDPVRVDHDAGLLRLPEDLGQPHHRQRPGGQQVPQHLPGADRRQLVHVPDQQQVRARRDRLDQLVGQDHVHHRGLVHHHQVRVQRFVGVERRLAARPQRQQPVDGGRLVAGQLGQPLGGPAGRRGQHDPGALGPGQLHHRPHGERLPAAGPAGQHRDPRGQGQPHRVGLFRRELGAGPAAQPAQRLVPVHGRERAQPVSPRGEQAEQGVRHGPFGLIEGRQVDGGDLRCGLQPTGRGHRLADHPLGRGQLVQARGDQLGRHVQDLGGVGDQVGRGQVAVAVVGRLGQGVGQAGLDPLRAVPGDADRGGDRVGGLEPDAPHVGGQPVRLGADHGDRRVAVLLVDPHRQRRGHPDALQEDHHLLDRLLLGPGGGDHRGALGAQPVDLDQPARLVLDDVHDVHAEVRDHAFGHHRADALDQPRAQVLLDARGGGGQHRGVGVHLELPAVPRVGRPAAAQPQELAHLRAEQRPDRGDQLRAAPLGRDPGDRVPGLRIGEGDPLQDAVQHRAAALAGHRRWHEDNCHRTGPGR